MGEGDDPSAQEIAEIRQLFEEYLQDNGAGDVDERDIHSIRTNDKLIRRYFKHVFELGGEQTEKARDMIVNSLKFRKENNMFDLTENDLSETLKGKGSLYSKNRDKEGKKLLVFDVKKHVKGKDPMAEMKKFFLYHVERIDREEDGDMLTMVFDCASCGLKNMDMEFIQYMIAVFKDSTPYNLNYILVLEMPWVLNAAWKVIKTWLPASAVKKIKFLTKSNVGEYVDEENRFTAWGGNDDWEYAFLPEVRRPIDLNVGNGNSNPLQMETQPSSDEGKRKVQFQEGQGQGQIPQSMSQGSISSQMSYASASPSRTNSILSSVSSSNYRGSNSDQPALLLLSPDDEVVFEKDANADTLVTRIVVKNISAKNLVFKVKTTNPDRYRVRPSLAYLNPGLLTHVDIRVIPNNQSEASIIKDKFLITCVIVGDEQFSNPMMADLMKKSKPEAEYRLRCRMTGVGSTEPAVGVAYVNASYSSSPAPSSALMNGVTPNYAGVKNGGDSQALKTIERMSKRIDHLDKGMELLAQDVAYMRNLMMFSILLTCILLIYVVYNNNQSMLPPSASISPAENSDL